MRLLDEIIDLAVDGTGKTPVLLRKCLLLARQLKNDRLRHWVDKELDGYALEDELPEYRRAGVAKGCFLGSFNARISNQPLPACALDKKHRHWASDVVLRQPIVAYETSSQQDEATAIFEWPADLVAIYQRKFIEGYTLTRAWLEIPNSTFPSLLDTVRNRVLRFALDLKDDLGHVGDDIDALPRDKVDRQVICNIFGGNNVVAASAQNFTQIGTVTVEKGDAEGLRSALKKIDVADSDIAELQTALAEDNQSAAPSTLGERTRAWLASLVAKLANAGASVAADTVKAEATKYLLQYLGLQ